MNKTRTFKLRPAALGMVALAAMLGLAPAAQAVDTTFSGFATLGYSRSDSDYTYQRFINKTGSFKRDSILAGQLDLRLTPQWSATVQAKLAADETADHGTELSAAWAFVAWRPANDWLLRAGKMRLPLYLYSESVEVGVARDMVRLPHELYSTVPTNNFTGLFGTHTFNRGSSEYTLDAYFGRASTAGRTWLRDGLPPVVLPGSRYRPVKVDVKGLVLTSREETLSWRVSLATSSTRLTDGSALPLSFPFVEIAPGLGYWQVDASLPGPGIQTVAAFRNVVLTAGAEWNFAPHWRLAAEAGRILQRDTVVGLNGSAGYVALFHNIGDFTPYASIALQRSTDGLMGWREKLTTPTLPAFVPGAAQINATQRMAGESSAYGVDQRSTALGVSYALSPTAKLQGEWMQTRVGRMSSQLDTPPGQPDPHGLRVRTVTVNLSVAF